MKVQFNQMFYISFWKSFLRDSIGLLLVYVTLWQVVDWTGLVSKFPHKPYFLYILIFLIFFRFLLSVRHLVIQSFGAGYDIRLIRGDILEGDENTLIGFSDTFQVDIGGPISPTSLQGQFLSRIFCGDVARLETAISQQLKAGHVSSVGTNGLVDKYPVGTVITLNRDDRLFFLAAYSSLNNAGAAKASVEGLTLTLFEVWSEVSNKSNLRPISVPLIGQGLARLSVLTPELALQLIALTFVLKSNEHRISSSLKIVVRPEDWHKIDPIRFKQFLKSLPGAI